MCGVFAAVAYGGEIDRDLLRRLASDAETRGGHAHGLAWVDAAGRLRRWRDQGRIIDNHTWLDWLVGAQAVIGHCRYATHGRWENGENNHPHPADSGWIVHNGVVHNHAALIEAHDLWPSSRCDSEVFGQLIETLPGSLLDRCRKAVGLADGSHVVLGLWTRPLRLAVVRAGNPLYVGFVGNVAYFCSLQRSIPGGQPIRDNTARLIVPREGELVQTVDDVAGRAAAGEGLFSKARA